MAIILLLTLDKTHAPWAVDVNETGNANRVIRANVRRKLLWRFTGNAQDGTFRPLDADPPGFRWISATPADAFGDPVLSDDRTELSITDLNNDLSTSGTFIYQLWIDLHGTCYSTIASTKDRTATNPAIINK